jgi:hypothetical protein
MEEAWLGMIPDIEEDHPELGDWVTVDGRDPLLEWVRTVAVNPVGDRQLALADCLVAHGP